VTERRPSFDELVGDDLTPIERERLLRVHDLLIDAGPPPELPSPAPVVLSARRRRGAAIAIAAALVLTVFAVGVAVGDRSGGQKADFSVAMSGTAAAAGASASLTVFEIDEAGNWPMEFAIEGLVPEPSGRPYELWLTKGGKLEVLCGGFLTDAAGSAEVPMNAPYNFDDYDGWVVVEEGSTTPLLTT
jgi:Anti-sigma-K factor rskA